MQSRGARIGVVIVAIAVVVVLFLVLREDDGDDGGPTTSVTEQTTEPTDDGAGAVVNPNQEPKPEPPPEPKVVEESIEIEAGAPVGGVAEIEVPSDEKAEITVSSPDTTDHVHLHGYDVFSDLAPGKPAKIEFKATIEGVFEMELEDSVTPIAEVTVK